MDDDLFFLFSDSLFFREYFCIIIPLILQKSLHARCGLPDEIVGIDRRWFCNKAVDPFVEARGVLLIGSFEVKPFPGEKKKKLAIGFLPIKGRKFITEGAFVFNGIFAAQV